MGTYSVPADAQAFRGDFTVPAQGAQRKVTEIPICAEAKPEVCKGGPELLTNSRGGGVQTPKGKTEEQWK